VHQSTRVVNWKVAGRVPAPKSHNMVSTIKFDIWIFLGEKLATDGIVLSQLGLRSNVLPGPFIDLSALVSFCTCNRIPPKNIHILKLIFHTLMWAWGQTPKQPLMSVNGPDNIFDLNPRLKITFPSVAIYCGICIGFPQKNPNINWKVAGRVPAPKAHNRVSTINFDIWIFLGGNWQRTA
jgi:hypothetical protein